MVPTLVGDSRTVRCDRCRLLWSIDASQPVSGAANLICAQCGQQMLAHEGPQFPITPPETAPDTVTIETMAELRESDRELTRGDLVALQWEGERHVKRIVAAPGDLVSLDGSRLLVNGMRIEDAMQTTLTRFHVPWMLVNDDSHQQPPTRWGCMEDEDNEQADWTRDGRWDYESTGRPPWLIYRHRNSYRGQAPSPVWDDYPFNVSLSRKLFEVDRLRLHGRAESAFAGRFAFWTSAGNVLIERHIESGEQFTVSCFDGVATDGLPVSPHRPIAISMDDPSASISSLVIERLVEYRLRPRDDASPYPLRLGPNQWFVLGDNVPVSVDSRQWGPVSGDHLIGRVEARDPPTRPLVIPLP